MSRTSEARTALLAVVALVAAAALLPMGPAAPALAADCEFRLGFKVIRDQIPAQVGQCLEDEWANPENGDALQRTTGGLMVWRKADNWTAFTDGSRTWINGPEGLQSRANNDRFSWENTPATDTRAAAPASSTPAQPAPPTPTPAPPPTPAPAPMSSGPGPITKQPAEIGLGLADMGKEITQAYLKTESDSRGHWSEIRFVRDEENVGTGFGPAKIVNRVYVANNVEAAQAIYQDEVAKQGKGPWPESEDTFGTIYVNDGKIPANTVRKVGEDQDSRAACNETCQTEKFNRLHQRTVFRYQNAVAVLYIWGTDKSSSTKQVDEWISKIRDRMS